MVVVVTRNNVKLVKDKVDTDNSYQVPVMHTPCILLERITSGGVKYANLLKYTPPTPTSSATTDTSSRPSTHKFCHVTPPYDMVT